jgi:cation transport ATPase
MSRSAGVAPGQSKDSNWSLYFPVFFGVFYGVEVFAWGEGHWYFFAAAIAVIVVAVGKLIRGRRRRLSHRSVV